MCWMHCWTVTVISIDVPACVIFVSFGASLVYTGVGTVVWGPGSFVVLLAYVASIMGGLLYMKLAQLIEIGPPNQDEEGRPPGPITVTIGEDIPDKEKYDSDGYYQHGAEA